MKLRLPDGESYDQTGTIDFLNVQVDQTTDSVTVRAQFPNPKRTLIAGGSSGGWGGPAAAAGGGAAGGAPPGRGRPLGPGRGGRGEGGGGAGQTGEGEGTDIVVRTA